MALTARTITLIKTEASTIPFKNMIPPIGRSENKREGVTTVATA